MDLNSLFLLSKDNSAKNKKTVISCFFFEVISSFLYPHKCYPKNIVARTPKIDWKIFKNKNMIIK